LVLFGKLLRKFNLRWSSLYLSGRTLPLPLRTALGTGAEDWSFLSVEFVGSSGLSFALTFLAELGASCQILPDATDALVVDRDAAVLPGIMLNLISCAQLIGPTLRDRRNFGVPVLRRNQKVLTVAH
jgi:hypothetical protein